MKCVQDCQTFLWGGTGSPRIDDDGECYCECEDEWSTYNVLGVPSCVPSKAHSVFGAVGLITAMCILCQSVHQLNRQVKYHAHYLAVSTSPAEKCRRHLHVVVIVHSVLCLCYFSLVLALEDYQLCGTVVFMSGLTQFTTNIGGMLTLRMWIYTNDPRLRQQTPEIMAMSNALERPAGQFATSCLVCIGAFAGTILAAARHSQTATKVACVAFMCMCVVVDLSVCRCGTSLLRTINKSMLQGQTSMTAGTMATTTTTTTAVGDEETGIRGGQFDGLFAARKKIRMATASCLLLGGTTRVMLLFSVSSPFGMFEPLLFFATPMGLAPLIWFGINVQVHAGRSKLRVTHRFLSVGTGRRRSSATGAAKILKAGGTKTPARGHHYQLKTVPMETPA